MSGSQSPVPFSTLLEQNGDATFEGVSPISKRCPTYKEFSDKIKQLQQENFQLRVRIYLGEQKSGVKMNSSDLGFFFPPHQQQQFQQFMQSQQQSSQSNTSAHSIANSETIKLQKEQLSTRVSELENKIHSYDILLKEKQKENAKLMEKNQDLIMQIEQMQTEVALAKIELHQQDIPTSLKVHGSEDEIERGARIAFGHYYDLEEINTDLEMKVRKEIEKVKALEILCEEKQNQIDVLVKNNTDRQNQVETLLRNEEEKQKQIGKDNQKRQVDINKLTKENEELTKKMIDFTKTYEGFGLEINTLNKQKEALNLKIEEYKLEIEDLRKKVVPEVVSSEKFSTICQLSEMLQTRVTELVAFIEALLILERQGVLTITGLTEPNRKNLREAINHTGMLSQSLDEVLGLKGGRESDNRKNFTIASFFNSECLHRSKSLIVSGKAAGDTHTATKSTTLTRSISSQCALLNPNYEASLTTANSQVSKLRRELAKLEQTRERLTNEKSQLYARVVSLEANVNALKNCGNIDKRSTPRDDSAIAALILDKKVLAERLQVSEAALTHLHQEHAKLVGELKVLRNSHANEPLTDLPEKLVNNVEGVRPSDSNSPDLGIDSGHDGAANSDDSNGNVFKAENRALRSANRELALKLRQTRQALDMTLEKLHSTTKQKEQVEKTICRQLHKTHTILRNAKKNLEKSASAQCQENIVP